MPKPAPTPADRLISRTCTFIGGILASAQFALAGIALAYSEALALGIAAIGAAVPVLAAAANVWANWVRRRERSRERQAMAAEVRGALLPGDSSLQTRAAESD